MAQIDQSLANELLEMKTNGEENTAGFLKFNQSSRLTPLLVPWLTLATFTIDNIIVRCPMWWYIFYTLECHEVLLPLVFHSWWNYKKRLNGKNNDWWKLYKIVGNLNWYRITLRHLPRTEISSKQYADIRKRVYQSKNKIIKSCFSIIESPPLIALLIFLTSVIKRIPKRKQSKQTIPVNNVLWFPYFSGYTSVIAVTITWIWPNWKKTIDVLIHLYYRVKVSYIWLDRSVIFN